MPPQHFRAIKGAVSLKLVGETWKNHLVPRYFRAIKGAVSLKRLVTESGEDRQKGFPRHQRRGLIEAKVAELQQGCPRNISAPSKARSH